MSTAWVVMASTTGVCSLWEDGKCVSTIKASSSAALQLSINFGRFYKTGSSTCDVSDVIIFNSVLANEDIEKLTATLMAKSVVPGIVAHGMWGLYSSPATTWKSRQWQDLSGNKHNTLATPQRGQVTVGTTPGAAHPALTVEDGATVPPLADRPGAGIAP